MEEMSTTGVALPPHTRLGQCEICNQLGQGGGGISYLAYDTHLEREVVIKEHFPPSLCFRMPGTAEVQAVSAAAYERSQASFCREARILAGLNHPGIVKVYDIFQASGTAYMVMEYVEGERLSDWLPAHADDAGTVTLVLKRLLEGMAYLHAHDVLHRDIKPANIIIKSDAVPVLLDFGAAMLGTPATTITLVGTPGYAAPEQFQQHGRIGPWSDLYALAHSFLRLIPADLLRRYPRHLAASLHKAAEADWERRFLNAAAWLLCLESGKSRMVRKLAVAASGILLLAAGGVYVFVNQKLERATPPVSPAAQVVSSPAGIPLPPAKGSPATLTHGASYSVLPAGYMFVPRLPPEVPEEIEVNADASEEIRAAVQNFMDTAREIRRRWDQRGNLSPEEENRLVQELQYLQMENTRKYAEAVLAAEEEKNR